ncbi:MAG TPA: DUF488 domain-containing protein [Candidatus Binatia bacterium]|jgi:uncharacterized protein (DUF488 family)|nr:DUF488 domain-containing protein [Candidatus Binatia bacterium]
MSAIANAKCESRRTVHTIGHSTRTLQAVIELLRQHSIEIVIDVRRWPASRRLPHFNRDALAAGFKAEGIAYLWRGDLGGFRKASPDSPNTGWRVAAFRAYADFMLQPEFARIMNKMEKIAGENRAAIMCAEAVPWRCHRQLLADAFVVRGWNVRHIMEDGCHEHHLTKFAAPQGTRIYYKDPATTATKLF